MIKIKAFGYFVQYQWVGEMTEKYKNVDIFIGVHKYNID